MSTGDSKKYKSSLVSSKAERDRYFGVKKRQMGMDGKLGGKRVSVTGAAV